LPARNERTFAERKTAMWELAETGFARVSTDVPYATQQGDLYKC